MFGLTISQEAALAAVALRRDELPTDLTDKGLSKQLLSLRDLGMLDMQTDWGGELAFVQRLLAEGASHYDQVRSARRRFAAISDDADELLDLLYSEAKAAKKADKVAALTYHDGRDEDYRELSRAGLLSVFWADNKPYCVNVTDSGWSYAEGWFMDQEVSMKVNISPTFNNSLNNSSNASARATAVGVTLGSTIQQILDLEIDQETKDLAEDAVKALDKSAKKKNTTDFLSKLEKVACIAKSSVELAGVIGPFIAKVAGVYFG